MTQQERIKSVVARAEEVFGSSQAAELWLNEPVPALDFLTPLAMLNTEAGARIVIEILGRIEHGVYS